MDYIVTGLNMMDVNIVDGKKMRPAIGGISVYGYAGMRPFTDQIAFVARVGADFRQYYDPWFTDNHISTDGIRVVSDQTPYDIITYSADGPIDAWEFFTGDWKDANYWRPKGEDLLPVIDEATKGFYISCGPEPEDVWPTLFHLKQNKKYPFKIMWEPNGINTYPDKREATLELLKKIEMASFSLVEGLRIFGRSDEEDLLSFLKDQPCELILLRVGARGLYTIHDGKIVFIPSAPLPPGSKVVDPTGCGNASTAAACYAWCEGNDMIMTGIMANVASSYNLRQTGPYPVFTQKDMDEATQLARTLYETGQYTIIS